MINSSLLVLFNSSGALLFFSSLPGIVCRNYVDLYSSLLFHFLSADAAVIIIIGIIFNAVVVISIILIISYHYHYLDCLRKRFYINKNMRERRNGKKGKGRTISFFFALEDAYLANVHTHTFDKPLSTSWYLVTFDLHPGCVVPPIT